MIQKSKKIKKQTEEVSKQQLVQNPFEFVPRKLDFQFDVSFMAIRHPELNQYIEQNFFGIPTINYNNQKVLALFNEIAMDVYFKCISFKLPIDSMQPCLGGRINYIEWVNDRIKQLNKNKQVVLVDVGCGCSAIYLILGHQKYGWKGIGIEQDRAFIENAENIIQKNNLQDDITFRTSVGNEKIFDHCLEEITSKFQLKDTFIVSVCNPPFYAIDEERLKVRQITDQETYTKGGEVEFIQQMFEQSRLLHFDLFTTLVGRMQSFQTLLQFFQLQKNVHIITGKLYQGNNVRWIISWKNM